VVEKSNLEFSWESFACLHHTKNNHKDKITIHEWKNNTYITLGMQKTEFVINTWFYAMQLWRDKKSSWDGPFLKNQTGVGQECSGGGLSSPC